MFLNFLKVVRGSIKQITYFAWKLCEYLSYKQLLHPQMYVYICSHVRVFLTTYESIINYLKEIWYSIKYMYATY